MSAKKATQSTSRLGRLLNLGGKSGWIVMALLLAGGLGAGWYVVWQRVRGHVLADSDYRLNPKDIEVTPQPRWIHADVKAEVIRDASFDASLSILETDLTVRIAQAFALHPWVERVNRVSKRHPAQVEVDLTYRQPVAMVEVAGGLLPVDHEAVLLPSDDFSSASARTFPRLSGINTEPAGPIGTNWGDGSVLGGTRLAAAIGTHWHELRLYRIVASTRLPGGQSTSDDGFELFTHAGTQIVWGHAPGKELAGEMPAAEKVARLVKHAQENGSLDAQTGSQRIDLRSGHEFIITPRTAIRSLPGHEPSE